MVLCSIYFTWNALWFIFVFFNDSTTFIYIYCYLLHIILFISLFLMILLHTKADNVLTSTKAGFKEKWIYYKKGKYIGWNLVRKIFWSRMFQIFKIHTNFKQFSLKPQKNILVRQILNFTCFILFVYKTSKKWWIFGFRFLSNFWVKNFQIQMSYSKCSTFTCKILGNESVFYPGKISNFLTFPLNFSTFLFFFGTLNISFIIAFTKGTKEKEICFFKSQ